MSQKVFKYWEFKYWVLLLAIVSCGGIIILVFINKSATVTEKWLIGLLFLAGMIGVEYERRRLLRRPWTIHASEDLIIGISRRGDRIEMAWNEIGKISRPRSWAAFWHGDLGVILESQDGKKQLYIGKVIGNYRELTQIIREKTPHLSHKYP